MPKLVVPKSLPEGVPLEAMNAVKSLIRDGRQVFGSAGASLTWGIDGSEDGVVGAGIEGERMTARIFRDWIANHPTVMLVHSVGWPGSNGDTDHIVIIGRTVYLVDSKRWKSKRKYSVTASGSIKRGTVDFPEGKVKMVSALNAWRGVLKSGITVRGVVCISQDEVFVPRNKEWYSAPYRLVTAEELTKFFDEAIEKMHVDEVDIVDLGLLSSIIVRAIKPRDRRRELINVDRIN